MLLLVTLAACDLPFGLGLASTRALENGAADTLGGARSLEITGAYAEAGASWSIDLQMVRPDTEHVVLSGAGQKLEAIVLGKDAYYRGQQFLAQHLGSDSLSRNLIAAAGNAWWKGPAGSVPQLPDLTAGSAFKAAFLGPVVTRRTDHVSVDGIDAVDLAGPRAEVFVQADPPYQLLRLRMRKGVVIDGLREGDLRFTNFGRDFGITAPGDVIDFSNLSTLPPIYTVISVDTSRCASPCVVSAVVKNLGGLQPAQASSIIKFAVTDLASQRVIGECQAHVEPDVGYNATTSVECVIGGLDGQQVNAAKVTATPDNPGRA
jgi:hypothetical protein